jgi:trigger factor
MELPEPMLEAQVQARIGELRQSLVEQEMPPEEVEKRLESETQNILASSARAMKAVYLMEEIAKAEDIQISEQDIVGELRGIAQRNNTDFEEVRKYYQQEGLVQQLALELLERKVRSLLRESADIQRI